MKIKAILKKRNKKHHTFTIEGLADCKEEIIRDQNILAINFIDVILETSGKENVRYFKNDLIENFDEIFLEINDEKNPPRMLLRINF